jgi:hypothetical protein
MINELTPKQNEQLINFRNECLSIGLSTEPLDRTKHRELVNWLYQTYFNFGGEPKIWYVNSPLTYNLIINILYSINDNFSDNISENLSNNLGDNLSNNLWVDLMDNLRTNFAVNLRNSLIDNLVMMLSNNLKSNLKYNLKESLSDNLWINFRDNIMNNLSDTLSDNLSDNLMVNLLSNRSDDISENLYDILRDNLSDNLSDSLIENLRDNFYNNFNNNLHKNLLNNLYDNLNNNLSDNLSDNLYDNLYDNLKNNLRINLGDNLINNLSKNLRYNLRNNKIFHNAYWGNWDINWISFYFFPYLFLDINYGEKLNNDLINMYELIKSIGSIFFHKNICFISERPLEIHKKGIQLHADGKPALLYSDGYCLWYLNGVRVNREIVMTPADELDCNLILTEKNAEVRREIIRKIGIERVVKKLKCKIIEKSDDGVYQLYEVPIGENRTANYLKMKNPSVDTWHFEGVPEECNTILKSLAWRDGESNYVTPSALT